MDKITVGLEERSYNILFGHGLLAETGNVCRELNLGSSVAVITNPTVGALYFEQVRSSLEDAGFTVHRVEIPDGEQYKNIDSLHEIYSRLIDCGLDRGSFILALGGGVVGDIAGFGDVGRFAPGALGMAASGQDPGTFLAPALAALLLALYAVAAAAAGWVATTRRDVA